MEIYPALQLALLLGAFAWGICLGGIWELVHISRILLGVYQPPAYMEACYARPLPWLHRPVPFLRQGIGRRAWRNTVVAVGDCLFCLLFAAVVVLLLYRYNDGAFRLSVPLLALLGLGVSKEMDVGLKEDSLISTCCYC